MLTPTHLILTASGAAITIVLYLAFGVPGLIFALIIGVLIIANAWRTRNNDD